VTARAERAAPVRPAPRGAPDHLVASLPGCWVLAGLVAASGIAVARLLWPLATGYPIATGVAVALFAGYAVPFVVLIRRLDFLEREHPLLLGSAGAWGALVAVAAAAPADVALQHLLARGFSPALVATWGPALAAPTVEEPLKVLGVLAIAFATRSQINSMVDGMVYGALAGLGFQVVEDILYAVNATALAGRGDTVPPVVSAFLLRGFLGGLWSHTLFSAVAGAGVAYVLVREDRPLWRNRLPLAVAALAAAWCLHFLLNSPWLADGFGYGGAAVLAALVLKGMPAVLLLLVLVRVAGSREAAYYTSAIAALGDPRLATRRELRALESGRGRAAARRYAKARCGRSAAATVRGLQHAQARLAVALSREADSADQSRAQVFRQEVLELRDRLAACGHPEACGPAGARTRWIVWVAGTTASAALAALLAAVIRALGGG
jgi:protease PrsW